MGPIDYLIVEWPDRQPTGEAAPHLIDLVDRGLVPRRDMDAPERELAEARKQWGRNRADQLRRLRAELRAARLEMRAARVRWRVVVAELLAGGVVLPTT